MKKHIKASCENNFLFVNQANFSCLCDVFGSIWHCNNIFSFPSTLHLNNLLQGSVFTLKKQIM
jgi:hypothetical protein